MRLSEVVFDFNETFGELMLIGEPKEVYVYADGKRTNELEAIGYPVISTRQWEKFVVKVKETVPSVEFNGKPTPVIFNNLDAKLWQDFRSNEIKISAVADQIEIDNPPRLRVNKGDAQA